MFNRQMVVTALVVVIFQLAVVFCAGLVNAASAQDSILEGYIFGDFLFDFEIEPVSGEVTVSGCELNNVYIRSN